MWVRSPLGIARHRGVETMWRDGVMARIGELSHPAWGPEHCRRLYVLARDIAQQEEPGLDDDVLFAAAWLHDAGTFGQFACDAEPPECAARAAERILADAGMAFEKIPLATRIIRQHSLNGDKPQTPEAGVLRDADMLEFLGAVGLMRLLSIVELEDWVPDSRAALSLAMQFADDFPPKLIYDTSRRIAEQRVAETLDFIGALSYETVELQII